ncbi:MAG: FAD-binding oxidoreductase [Beijerinckiaceae bacterium]|nr:FAD-binding oxidoreductase [Beijerinckiaceae bacterium]MCI0597937.1 FAD-binding oxidoreductase [Beijerinckiaceae bacterium]MCI0736543.1 FAD-binding oxidoreductase [Beijerinckiaceae bacterium]
MEVSGFGRYPRFETAIIEPSSLADAVHLQSGLTGFVPRGNGRAYGDAAIGTASCLSLLELNQIRDFDEVSGRLTVEAGVLLADIIAMFLPRGFFPPVVPGTRFVTVGGMIASDIHGKNHHGAGSFGKYVESMNIALPGGEVVLCSPDENRELFEATIGGMGLTGTVVLATFSLVRVETGWIKQHTIVAGDLAAALAILSKHEESSYSAAWIDCLAKGSALGRSLIYLGDHASAAEIEAQSHGAPQMPSTRARRLSVPLDLPSFTLNRWTVAAFNEVYFRRGASSAGKVFINGIEPFFFPLDGILNWNRIYGRRGFLQHQSVVPEERAQAVYGEILGRIAKRGNASFLAVLKKLGASSKGLLSFPQPGFTLALDLAIDSGIFDFLDTLDELVAAAGGRIYLAKDARQSRATFESGYPNLQRFREIRQNAGVQDRIKSRLSERLGI